MGSFHLHVHNFSPICMMFFLSHWIVSFSHNPCLLAVHLKMTTKNWVCCCDGINFKLNKSHAFAFNSLYLSVKCESFPSPSVFHTQLYVFHADYFCWSLSLTLSLSLSFDRLFCLLVPLSRITGSLAFFRYGNDGNVLFFFPSNNSACSAAAAIAAVELQLMDSDFKFHRDVPNSMHTTRDSN